MNELVATGNSETKHYLCCTSHCTDLLLPDRCDLCTQRMSYQMLHGKSRNILILDELCFRGLVHNWLSVMFEAAVVVIGHAQVGMTADREWIPCKGSTGRNGLEKNKLGTIPFINKRVSVVGTSRAVAGKSEEYVTIDINRLHVKCPVSLKRLWFDKVSS